MKIVVSGASGFIGSALVPYLRAGGHEVVRLVRDRREAAADAAYWDPAAGELAPGTFAGVDGVVHLSGENLAGGRFTEKRKARIRDSRIDSTRLIARALAQMAAPPRVFVSVSAVGYYGNRGDALLTEDEPPGQGFLAEVCAAWEAAADAAREHVRVVHPRFGLVLDPRGGMLRKMLVPFRLGLGAVVGDGQQWMSWITRDDLIRLLVFLLEHEEIAGPVNAVTPDPVRNRDFTRTLARVLHRPAVLRLPAFALRAALGEMADETVLTSTRVDPAQLRAAGFVFQHPELEGALRSLLS